MTPEQKQQAQQAIEGWWSVRNDDPMKPAGDVLAALLQELVDAPEPEPVAFQVRNGWASVAIYQRQIDAENYAKDQQKRHDLSGSLASFCVVPLYTTPPAPSVPDGWREVAEQAEATLLSCMCSTARREGGCLEQGESCCMPSVKSTVHALREMLAAAPTPESQTGLPFGGFIDAANAPTPAEAPAMPKLKFLAEFDEGDPVEIEVFGTERNLNRLAARIEYYENLDRSAEATKCIWCGKDTKLGHEFNCRLKESAKAPAEAPADVARDAELLCKLKHSIGQAKISGNDWRRELELMSRMIDAAMSEKGGA